MAFGSVDFPASLARASLETLDSLAAKAERRKGIEAVVGIRKDRMDGRSTDEIMEELNLGFEEAPVKKWFRSIHLINSNIGALLPAFPLPAGARFVRTGLHDARHFLPSLPPRTR